MAEPGYSAEPDGIREPEHIEPEHYKPEYHKPKHQPEQVIAEQPAINQPLTRLRAEHDQIGADQPANCQAAFQPAHERIVSV